MRRTIIAFFLSLWASVAVAGVNCTLPFNLQNNTTADATQVMANYNALVACLQQAASSGNNNDITALLAMTTPLTPGAGGSTIYTASTSGGTANAQTVGITTPTGFTLTAGKRVTFIAGFTNTGAMTLNVNGTGIVNVFKYSFNGPEPLAAGEVTVTNYVEVVYDGTQYILYTNASTAPYGSFIPIASASTTDIGTLGATHFGLINGTTTINGFGSSASINYPIYLVQFNGVLTLVNSGALLLPGSTNIVTANGDVALLFYRGSGNWTVLQYSKINGTSTVGSVAPNAQLLTAASGTYTTPANARWLLIRGAGGGSGGGGGQNGGGSGAGGTTCWAASGAACSAPIFQATGGAASNNVASGAAGVGSGGYSSLSGTPGGMPGIPGVGFNATGGTGGPSCLGGAGIGSSGSAGAGAAPANSGGGGGGGGATNNTLTGSSGAGGAGGGCFLAIINSPAATYTYAIGAAGTGAAGGSSSSSAGGAGGAGGSGAIEVLAYQ
jgi:hypothetical protein